MTLCPSCSSELEKGVPHRGAKRGRTTVAQWGGIISGGAKERRTKERGKRQVEGVRRRYWLL